ncbi:MAG: VOC family protein [Bacteroidota bacterium]|jgi:hypothetical protein
MTYRINGIQHLGLGSDSFIENWKWLRTHFGFDVPMFDSVAEAELMKYYTENTVVNKRAAMILNLQGGCPVELIELRSRKPVQPAFEIRLGDLGIFAGKIKIDPAKLEKAKKKFDGLNMSVSLSKQPHGGLSGFLTYGNGVHFQLIEGDRSFTKGPHETNGIAGCIIGCRSIEESKSYYALFGYDHVLYEGEGVYDDFKELPGGEKHLRRCLLGKSVPQTGGFAALAGETFIELVQMTEDTPRNMYEGRIWGDVGFVHLGMDVRGMGEIEKMLSSKGYPFKCDSSNGLHMGQTRVHCTYVEDPNGILIELIEVYKIPIMEKWNLFLNVEKRAPEKPLPNWMLKAMRFSRIKDDYWTKKNI